MIYDLGFLESALKEWRKLDSQTRDQFRKKLGERLQNPRVPSSRLSGQTDRYKIKLRNIGYRLVYDVRDAEVIVVVVAVGRRDRDALSHRRPARRRRDRARRRQEAIAHHAAQATPVGTGPVMSRHITRLASTGPGRVTSGAT